MHKNISNIASTPLSLDRATVAFSTLRNIDSAEAAAPYAGFSICHYTADSDAHIADCRRSLSKALQLPWQRIIVPRQTHSVSVACIDSIPFDPARLEGVDALVTVLPDVALCINTADCVPIVLSDPQAGIIAAAHAGWRGAIGGIARLTVEAMVRHGADTSRIKAALGPCICSDCFEVGEDVADRFREAFPANPPVTYPAGSQARPHVDLPQAVRLSLIEAGLDERLIAMPTECSRCNPARYFSARRLGVDSGRILTVVCRPVASAETRR